MAEANRVGAIPYDVKDVELGHHGKECSFEAILKKYELRGEPALVLLGRIVNGADTDNTLPATGWTGAGGGRRRFPPSRLQGRSRAQRGRMDRLRPIAARWPSAADPTVSS
jgi:Chromate resistance exported protein